MIGFMYIYKYSKYTHVCTKTCYVKSNRYHLFSMIYKMTNTVYKKILGAI